MDVVAAVMSLVIAVSCLSLQAVWATTTVFTDCADGTNHPAPLPSTSSSFVFMNCSQLVIGLYSDLNVTVYNSTIIDLSPTRAFARPNARLFNNLVLLLVDSVLTSKIDLNDALSLNNIHIAILRCTVVVSVNATTEHATMMTLRVGASESRNISIFVQHTSCRVVCLSDLSCIEYGLILFAYHSSDAVRNSGGFSVSIFDCEVQLLFPTVFLPEQPLPTGDSMSPSLVSMSGASLVHLFDVSVLVRNVVATIQGATDCYVAYMENARLTQTTVLVEHATLHMVTKGPYSLAGGRSRTSKVISLSSSVMFGGVVAARNVSMFVDTVGGITNFTFTKTPGISRVQVGVVFLTVTEFTSVTVVAERCATHVFIPEGDSYIPTIQAQGIFSTIAVNTNASMNSDDPLRKGSLSIALRNCTLTVSIGSDFCSQMRMVTTGEAGLETQGLIMLIVIAHVSLTVPTFHTRLSVEHAHLHLERVPDPMAVCPQKPGFTNASRYYPNRANPSVFFPIVVGFYVRRIVAGVLFASDSFVSQTAADVALPDPIVRRTIDGMPNTEETTTGSTDRVVHNVTVAVSGVSVTTRPDAESLTFRFGTATTTFATTAWFGVVTQGLTVVTTMEQTDVPGFWLESCRVDFLHFTITVTGRGDDGGFFSAFPNAAATPPIVDPPVAAGVFNLRKMTSGVLTLRLQHLPALRNPALGLVYFSNSTLPKDSALVLHDVGLNSSASTKTKLAALYGAAASHASSSTKVWLSCVWYNGQPLPRDRVSGGTLFVARGQIVQQPLTCGAASQSASLEATPSLPPAPVRIIRNAQLSRATDIAVLIAYLSGKGGIAPVQWSAHAISMGRRCAGGGEADDIEDAVGSSFIDNPLQLRVASLPMSVQLAGGAVIGNVAIVLLCGALRLAWIAWRLMREGGSGRVTPDGVATLAELPWSLFSPISVLLQPTIVCASALLAEGSASSSALGTAGLASAAVLPVYWCWVVFFRLVALSVSATPSNAWRRHRSKTSRPSVLWTLGDFARSIVAPGWSWSSRTTNGRLLLWIVDGYAKQRQWFYTIETGANLVASLVAGAAPTSTPAACDAAQWCLCLIAVGMVVAAVTLKPMNASFDDVMAAVLNLLTAVVILLILFDDDDTATTLALVQAVVSLLFVLTLLHNVLVWAMRHRDVFSFPGASGGSGSHFLFHRGTGRRLPATPHTSNLVEDQRAFTPKNIGESLTQGDALAALVQMICKTSQQQRRK